MSSMVTLILCTGNRRCARPTHTAMARKNSAEKKSHHQYNSQDVYSQRSMVGGKVLVYRH